MRKTALLATAVVLFAPACHVDWSERLTGTAMGGLAGGTLGGLVAIGGTTASGIILGAVAGAAAGYIIGDYLADQRERACGGAPACAPESSPCGSASEAAPAVAPAVASRGAAPSVERASGRAPDPGAWGKAANGGAAKAEYEAGRRASNPNVALGHYAAAIRLEPLRPEAYNAQGLVYLYLGRSDAARRSFEQSLAVDKTYEPARFNLRKVSGGP